MTIAEFLTKYNTRFADNTTGEIDPEDLRNFANDISGLFEKFDPILANSFGTEPTVDLNSQAEVNAYLFALATGTTYNPPTTEPAPDAPTLPVTNDAADAFTFTLATTNAPAPAPSGGTPSDNNDSFTYSLAQL